MVYCRYCGAKNRDGDLRCTQCNKPLSLMSNDSPSRPNSRSSNSSNLNNPYSEYDNQNSPIKNKYLEKDQNFNEFREDNRNSSIRSRQSQSQNQRNENPLNSRNPNNSNINPNNREYDNQNIRQINQNNIDPNMRNQYYQNYENNQKYSNSSNGFYEEQNYSKNREEYRAIDKTAVEWDVVIATALIVIILTAILQRIFPFFAIFISLFIGLAYILVATKSKSSLFKSIPLAVLTILAISAYFSI